MPTRLENLQAATKREENKEDNRRLKKATDFIQRAIDVINEKDFHDAETEGILNDSAQSLNTIQADIKMTITEKYSIAPPVSWSGGIGG